MTTEADTNLDILREASEERFSSALYYYANRYATLLGLDFWNDIYPNLGKNSWWEADYGQKTRDGISIGMSTKDAFRCLVDTRRTFKIYQGLKQVIQELKDDGREDLVAIDAGTGTGILSIIMASLGVNKIHAIEINDETFTITNKFLSELDLADKINLIKGDATTLDIPHLKDVKADILVSENLSSGLLDEPQYDIINNLSKYIKKDAEIIPSSAELYVSLAVADWEGVDQKRNNIAMRRLRSCTVVSPRIKYAKVDSVVGMEIPTIDSSVFIPTDFIGDVNALLISTRFKVNNIGDSSYLEPDSAHFLGKTSAFRIGNVGVEKGGILVNLKYRTGRERKYLEFSSMPGKLDLRDTMLKI